MEGSFKPGPAAGALAQLRPVAAAVLAVAIASAATGLMTTKVSLDLELHKAGVNAVRLVVTGYPLGFIAGCLTVRTIVARAGHGRTFLGLIVVLALLSLAFAATPDPSIWFLLRVGSGFALAAIYTVVESWINLESRLDNRGALLSFYMILSTSGTAAGPLLIGLNASDGMGSIYLAAAVYLLSGLPLLLSGRMTPSSSTGSQRPRFDKPLALKVLFAAAPAAVAGALQVGMTNMTFAVMAPIYATRIGYGPAAAGALVSVFALGGLLAQWPVGWLSDRVPRHKVIAVAGFVAAFSCALIYALAHLSPVLLYGLVFLYGGSTIAIYPLVVAFASSRIEPMYQVSLASRLLLLYGLGSIASPALTNELMARLGPSALFALLGAAALAVSMISTLNASGFINKEKRV